MASESRGNFSLEFKTENLNGGYRNVKQRNSASERK